MQQTATVLVREAAGMDCGNPAGMAKRAEVEVDPIRRARILFALECVTVAALLLAGGQAGGVFASRAQPLYALCAAVATAALGATFAPWFREHWRGLILVLCANTIAFFALARRNEGDLFAPMFTFVALLSLGGAALLPWEPRWQAALNGACLAAYVVQDWTLGTGSPVFRISRLAALVRMTALAQYVSAAENHDRDARRSDGTPRRGLEDSFRLLFESMPYATFLAEGCGRIVMANSRALAMFGYSQGELVGKEIENLVAERFRDAHRGCRTQCSTNSQLGSLGSGLEVYGLRGDGSEFPAVVRMSPIRYDDGIFVLSIVREIAARRQAETTHAVLTSLVRSSEDAILTLDPGGKILSWNAGAETLTGYRAEEVVGESVSSSRTLGQPDAIMAALGKLPEPQRYETVGQRKDGTLAEVEITISPIHDVQGKMVCAWLIARDVGARNRAMHELTQVTAELMRSNAELEQFAYAASHDLREPLQIIASHVQLLERRYKDKLDADANEFIRYAVDGANRMKTLISALLTYSRAATGQDFGPVNCAEALENVMSSLKFAIDESGARIRPGALPTVRGIAPQIVQLLQNLVGNAIKFRGSEPPLVRVEAQRSADEWLFSVADNGIGIAPESGQRIFEVFQRPHGQNEYPGSGVGLAICRRIVEHHGGRIWMESKPGRGTTFHFTMPAWTGKVTDETRKSGSG